MPTYLKLYCSDKAGVGDDIDLPGDFRRGIGLTSKFSFRSDHAIARSMVHAGISLTMPTRTICILWLAVSVFLAQGLQIHMHTYDHVPGQIDYVHQNPIHVHLEAELNEAHPDEAPQFDFTEDGIRINLSIVFLIGLFLAGVFVSLRTLLIFRPYAVFRYCYAHDLKLRLLPPSHAPPF